METIIISVVTFVLGYAAGIYLPIKFRKEDREPNISIGPFQDRQNYFEITNHGGDILNLSVKITWLKEGSKEKRQMEEFFNVSEDPALGYSHGCNSLKKGETKKVIHCPMSSDDGKVNVIIQGKNIDGKKYEKLLSIENNIKK